MAPTTDFISNILANIDALRPRLLDEPIAKAVRKAVGRKRAKELIASSTRRHADAQITCACAMSMLSVHWPQVAATLGTEPQNTGPGAVWCILALRYPDLVADIEPIYNTCSGLIHALNYSDKEDGFLDKLDFLSSTWGSEDAYEVLPILPPLLLGVAQFRKFGEVGLSPAELSSAPSWWQRSDYGSQAGRPGDERPSHAANGGASNGHLKVEHLIGASYGLAGVECRAVDHSVAFALYFAMELASRCGVTWDADNPPSWRVGVILYAQIAALPVVAGHYGLGTNFIDRMIAGVSERIIAIGGHSAALTQALKTADANALLTNCAKQVRDHMSAMSVPLTEDLVLGLPMMLATCGIYFEKNA